MPGYTHKTIHILRQLLFIELLVTDVVCDFGLLVCSFSYIAHFHFIIVLILSTEI